MEVFFIGLGIGLVFAVVIGINGWGKRRSLVTDNRRLKEHLHVTSTINAKGNQELLQNIEQLKKESENLRITVAFLKDKPNRSEMRTLYLYDKAIHQMYEKVPGFASAWEAVLKDAERDMNQVDTGVIAWVRKIIRPSFRNSTQQPLSLPADQAKAKIEFLKQEQKSLLSGKSFTE